MGSHRTGFTACFTEDLAYLTDIIEVFSMVKLRWQHIYPITFLYGCFLSSHSKFQSISCDRSLCTPVDRNGGVNGECSDSQVILTSLVCSLLMQDIHTTCTDTSKARDL